MTKSSGIDQFEVGNNSIFLLPAGQITTTTKISKNIEGYYLHFSNDLLIQKFDFSFWWAKPILTITKNEKERIFFLLAQIEKNYNENPNTQLIESYLHTFLTEISYLTGALNKNKLSTAEKIIVDFKLLLSKYCASEHKVEFYANQLNITANHLNKCAKNVLNKSASSLISESLILEAKVLLHQQKWNISELAYQLGFEDPSYFGRFFKKHTQKSPSEFLKMIDLSE